MRVIAGIYKGRKLAAPPGKEIRPTTDKTKEAIFSILTNEIPGARVLDIFSGTGALGIEALSRGADICVFCEKSKTALSQIRDNLDHCGIDVRTLHRVFETDEIDEPVAAICPGDMEKTLDHIAQVSNGPFDVILMDPPYGQGLCQKAMEIIGEEGLLDEDGLIVCEHPDNEELPDEAGGFVKTKERRYGISRVSIYRRK